MVRLALPLHPILGTWSANLVGFTVLLFAKSLRRHQKDFFPLDLSTSVLDGRLIRRMAKDARRKGEPCLGGLQEKSLVFRTIALESKLPPHNDGAARRVWERIESCSRPQSEVL